MPAGRPAPLVPLMLLMPLMPGLPARHLSSAVYGDPFIRGFDASLTLLSGRPGQKLEVGPGSDKLY